MRLCKHHGLALRWFDRKPVLARDNDRELRSMVRSFFEAPRTVYLNRELQDDPARLKFDLASHLGHKVLHDGDGLKSRARDRRRDGRQPGRRRRIAARHEARRTCCTRGAISSAAFSPARCSRPKVPFRRFLTRESHRVEAGDKIELTPAVMMRRMTKVSPYPYWHFFDAYPPGYLRAVYRGNGIPLPWGNMAQVDRSVPALGGVPHARRHRRGPDRGSQISVLRDGDQSMLYCCHSRRTGDMAGNPHVLSVGIDLVPALRSHGVDAGDDRRRHHRGMPPPSRRGEDPEGRGGGDPGGGQGAEHRLGRGRAGSPARIICPRSAYCPRTEPCDGAPASRAREIGDVRQEIVRRRGAADQAPRVVRGGAFPCRRAWCRA